MSRLLLLLLLLLSHHTYPFSFSFSLTFAFVPSHTGIRGAQTLSSRHSRAYCHILLEEAANARAADDPDCECRETRDGRVRRARGHGCRASMHALERRAQRRLQHDDNCVERQFPQRSRTPRNNYCSTAAMRATTAALPVELYVCMYVYTLAFCFFGLD